MTARELALEWGRTVRALSRGARAPTYRHPHADHAEALYTPAYLGTARRDRLEARLLELGDALERAGATEADWRAACEEANNAE